MLQGQGLECVRVCVSLSVCVKISLPQRGATVANYSAASVLAHNY